jgi:hypothetical protein
LTRQELAAIIDGYLTAIALTPDGVPFDKAQKAWTEAYYGSLILKGGELALPSSSPSRGAL